MDVLVAGATGRLGGPLADSLIDRGHRVRALTRDPESAAAVRLEQRGARIVAGDLDDPPSLRRAAARADAVFVLSTPHPGTGLAAGLRRNLRGKDRKSGRHHHQGGAGHWSEVRNLVAVIRNLRLIAGQPSPTEPVTRLLLAASMAATAHVMGCTASIGRPTASAASLPPDPHTAAALLKIAATFNHDYDTGDYGPVYARWDPRSQAIITRADYIQRHKRLPGRFAGAVPDRKR